MTDPAAVSGWIFIILAVTGVRGKLIQLAPRSLMLATSAGIGLFLAFIGLQARTAFFTLDPSAVLCISISTVQLERCCPGSLPSLLDQYKCRCVMHVRLYCRRAMAWAS